MQHCPRCDRRTDDDSALCHLCGGLLTVLSDPSTPPPPPPSVEETTPAPPPAEDWRCACDQMVSGTFDSCWSCGGPRPEANTTPPPKLLCVACGSDRIVDAVRIADEGEGAWRDLHLILDRNPQAMILRDRLRVDLFGRLCGECGHVGLFVRRPDEAYRHIHGRRKDST